MKIDIVIPSGSESVTEADIARWYKKAGDSVEKDEPVVELETDKSSMELSAEESGTLSILFEAGSTVEVGAVIGSIDTEGGAPLVAEIAEDEPDDAAEADEPVQENAGKTSAVMDPTMPSPAARKLMIEHGISALDISGTGNRGHITKADVLKHLQLVEEQTVQQHSRTLKLHEHPLEGNMPIEATDETMPFESTVRTPPDLPRPSEPPRLPAPPVPLPPVEAPAQPGAAARGERREKMSRLRKTIASRLLSSQQSTATLTTFNEIDMSAIMGIRKSYKEVFKKKHDIGLGFMSFFIKAASQALQEFPDVNAAIEGNEIVYHDYCDIGIAVSTPKGLVVPVIRSAETLAFHEVEQSVVELAIKGRDGELTLDDLSGGTFTITNGGIFGSMLSTPIINPPQAAILGMHNIVERPVAVDGKVEIRPIMYLALSYDHRLIDGSGAVRFLVKVKELCEDPTRLMLAL